ncbi:immunoglobulin-like and fibronectin type III domain-containing protein 1 [Denticeps clupeoides]|uniref:immunoglobulin-like and fibronectin type III domain-containing protein 1 n=1 Tax=Denticeps clupeoides TaxID=299321 RepID=UPI0010A4DFEA|nr:immunoglobulin-like and fibronectin type III domain-containing protein 1 [Denticeps clupeoides]
MKRATEDAHPQGKDDEDLPPGAVAIKKRSRVPGVMITQHVEEVPKGKSTPDITRKPFALTIQEGKLAFFKAVVTGDPTPTVTWARTKGDTSDPEKYRMRYDEKNGEYLLEMPNVAVNQADTYKCFATNMYGKAVCTTTLTVIEASQNDPEDFRKLLKKTTIVERKKKPKPQKEGEIDPKLLELLLSAQKKDYERICADFGVTDFRWLLKKLNMLKKEREEEQSKMVEQLDKVDQVVVKTDGTAEFGVDMKLKDPNSQVLLYKDGVMLPYSSNNEMKHNLQQKGSKYTFSIRELGPEDAGLYQIDVEDCNVLSTDFKIPEVEFSSKLQDGKAKEGESVEFGCSLSAPVDKITWYSNDKVMEEGEKCNIIVSEDKLVHKLVIKDCETSDSGTITAIVGITPCHASLCVEDARVHFTSGLSDTVSNKGESVELSCVLSSENCVGVWYKDGKKLESKDDVKIVKDGCTHKLIISSCKEEDAGRYRFEADGRKSEAALAVEDPPRIDSEALGKFSEPVIVRAGDNAAFALPFSGKEPMKVHWYKADEELLSGPSVRIEASNTQSSLRLIKCQRKDTGAIKIKIKNEHGTIEAQSKLIVLAFPGQPAPPKVVSAFKDCINLTWLPPPNTGGASLVGYNLQKRKRGSNLWNLVNPPEEPIKEKKYAVKDVFEGAEYEFRVVAINVSGAGEPSLPSDFVFARDPKKPPGKVTDLKLTGSSYNTLCLAWSKPRVLRGVEDEAKGYFVEVRPIESVDWSRCSSTAAIQTSFTVVGLKPMAMYWVQVIAANEGGEGFPHGFDNYIIAMPPPVRPRFTDQKMKSFVVMRAGNTLRVHVAFEASPLPDITWLKDGAPVARHVTVTNSAKGSQLLIPTAERSDSGIYTIMVKNLVGQETFNIEIRVTDDPKPPGPVELEQSVPGTVTLSWTPSPDEKRDDRLHYMVAKRDSVKRTWRTVADHLYNNKFTAANILPGREYFFRVFAKNDMGFSEPTEAPTWGTTKKREKFTLVFAESKPLNLQTSPDFLVPLKMHAAPQGYECYMTCAVRGNPAPHVTWYRDNMSLNTNANYYITNVCGVCSMLILRVGPNDRGEYRVVAENNLGVAECSTTLTVRE